MAVQTWVTLVNAYQTSSTTPGIAYKSEKTIKDISPGGKEFGALKIPENFLQPGMVLRYTASGWYSTKTAEKPTFIMGIYYGGVSAAKPLAITRTIETSLGVSKQAWNLQAISRVTAGGEKGKIATAGFITGLQTPAGSTTLSTSVTQFAEEKEANEVEVNLNKAEILTLGGTWGTESAENTLTCVNWLVELLS